MTTFIKTAIATFALIAASANAHAQGFDCRHAMAASEIAVCNSPSLRYLDERLNIEFGNARRSQHSRRAEIRLIRSQRSWLRHRNRCGASRTCLRQTYQRRMHVLGNQIPG